MINKDLVLVVDDLEINRMVLESCLGRKYEVVSASGGFEALELIKKNDFQIALLDVHMPGMNGFELAIKIRELTEYHHLPIIFISGDVTDTGKIAEGLSLGAVDYICKPYDFKILMAKIATFVDLNIKTKALHREIAIRKKSEEQLLESLNREEQLREKLKLSEKMEAIGRLSSGISHDFNNLMTAMIGHAELLNKINTQESLNRHINAILSICESGIEISDKLKVFSRSRSTRKKVFDLNQTLLELKEMCEFSIESNIQKSFSIPDCSMWINSNRSDVQNCLLNMIINARDAIRGVGEIKVKASIKELDAEFCNLHSLFNVTPGSYACVEISDNGCGMDSETKTKVFEPFFTTKERLKGTGLGMATAFGTVIETNGLISIESEIGKGTTVLVCLPLTHQEETEAKTVNRKDMSLLGVKVLVVDDEEQNLNYMKSLLEYYGAEVNSFSSAPEVLNQIDSIRNTDVAIVDYIMPEMNGAQLVAELKEYMPNLAMLMVSGICSQVELDALRENGTYLISKPFHSEDFISAVQDIAQKS